MENKKQLNKVINTAMLIKILGSIAAFLIAVCFHYLDIDWLMIFILIFFGCLLVDKLFLFFSFRRLKCTRRCMIKKYIKKYSLLYMSRILLLAVVMYICLFLKFNFFETLVYGLLLNAFLYGKFYAILFFLLTLIIFYLIEISLSYFVSFAAFKNEYSINKETKDHEKKVIIKKLVFDSFFFNIIGSQFLTIAFLWTLIFALKLFKLQFNIVYIAITAVLFSIVIWCRFIYKHSQPLISSHEDVALFRSSVRKTYGVALALQMAFIVYLNLSHGHHSHLSTALAIGIFCAAHNLPKSILLRKKIKNLS